MLKSSLPAGLLLALSLVAPAALAEAARCHYSYGGETQTLAAAPSAMPYMEPTHAIGSYFRVRIVLEAEPVELAALKTYVYADHDSGPVLIHQGVWPWPASEAAEQRHGFTGLQRVYEPVRDGELEFWCALDETGGEG